MPCLKVNFMGYRQRKLCAVVLIDDLTGGGGEAGNGAALSATTASARGSGRVSSVSSPPARLPALSGPLDLGRTRRGSHLSARLANADVG